MPSPDGWWVYAPLRCQKWMYTTSSSQRLNLGLQQSQVEAVVIKHQVQAFGELTASKRPSRSARCILVTSKFKLLWCICAVIGSSTRRESCAFYAMIVFFYCSFYSCSSIYSQSRSRSVIEVHWRPLTNTLLKTIGKQKQRDLLNAEQPQSLISKPWKLEDQICRWWCFQRRFSYEDLFLSADGYRKCDFFSSSRERRSDLYAQYLKELWDRKVFLCKNNAL